MNDSNGLTSRQRVAAALRHECTDRVPLEIWWTDETGAKLHDALGIGDEQELRDKLGLDGIWIWPEYTGRPLADMGPDVVVSYWGYANRGVKYDGGVYMEFCHHPLAGVESVQQVDDYAWPDPQAFDYETLPAKIAAGEVRSEKWVTTGTSSIFERSWAMVGLQEFLEKLVIDTEVAVRIMEHVNDFYIEHTLDILRACGGRADMIYTADDIGSQNGMLLSPDLWRQTIKPLQKKFNDAIRAEFPGIRIHYHSCGSILPVIDDLIEVGVDLLNPLQPKAAGMDPQVLAEKWGERLSFCGGVDIQELMPRGTAEQVSQKCSELIKTLGRSGGYVLAPAHAIQVDTPVENILALSRAPGQTPPPQA
ncbi:MAG: uroporphyrinogen decarboxylase family protein [Planctomycetota bacterium]|nr:uroporphyrinogen decarboxylase family protein [Planctomycetota bacterium]